MYYIYILIKTALNRKTNYAKAKSKLKTKVLVLTTLYIQYIEYIVCM